MQKIYDLLVFVGRFQPFHNSHKQVLTTALQKAQRVLVLIGSANRTRSPKNPFTATEREVMIKACFPEAKDRLSIAAIRDFPYMEDLWLREVQDAVEHVSLEYGAQKIGMIGHSKDESSYYLKCFPQWDQVEVPNFEGRSATELRGLLLTTQDVGSALVLESAVPGPCLEFIKTFQRLPQFAPLEKEYRFIQEYRRQYAVCPYPPTFVTVDNVVVHSGHILLVERRAMPGEGLLALPGGFIGEGERLIDAAIRELKEETRLKLPVPVLKGSIKASRVFDDPGRSQRGRTITHAFHFEFPSGPLPAVKGGDDARRAQWVSLGDFYALDGQMFEDHWHIVASFLGGA